MRAIAKPLWGQLHRGFESLPLRQLYLALAKPKRDAAERLVDLGTRFVAALR